MRPTVLAVVAWTLSLGSIDSIAHAGEAESRTFFAEGRQLRGSGQCDKAIIAFRNAAEAYPDGLGAFRNIAECEEQLGRYASARRTWWDLRLAVLRAGKSKYEGWDKDAEEARQRLKPRVARLVVRVKGKTDAPVYINGLPLDRDLLGSELEQDLGPVEITLRDGSASPPTKTLTLGEGKSYQVELEVIEKLAPKAGPVPPSKVEPPPKRGPDGLMIGGVVSLGLAGAAAIGLGVTLGLHQSALGDLEELCPNLDDAPCSLAEPGATEARDAKSRGETMSTLVNVFAATGGIAAATGVGLLIASALRPDEPAKTGVLEFDVAPAPGDGMTIWLRGRF